MQTKRRKTIRWYLVEGGGIQRFQIKLKFWHYTTNKFDLQVYRDKHMKLFIDIVMKRIYLFNTVAWNYRKKIGFPVCRKENVAGLQTHRKREKSARASPTPHHALNEERSARFTAQHLSALSQTLRVRYPFQSTGRPISHRNGWSFRVYMIPLRDFMPEWNCHPGTRTGVNSRRGDSRRHGILWWYHVNKYRAMSGNRSVPAPGRKSRRCRVNTPLVTLLFRSPRVALRKKGRLLTV